MKAERMEIGLYTANANLLTRWTEILSAQYSLFPVNTDKILCRYLQEKRCQLFIVHDQVVGVEVLRQIRLSYPKSRMFITSDSPDDIQGIAFLQLGVVGYSNSYIAELRLVQAIKVIQAGGVWIGQSIVNKLIHGLHIDSSEESARQTGAVLSKREKTIALCIADGLSNREIAHQLSIAEQTVKVHLRSIYRKTDTRGRLQLALKMKGLR